MRPQNCNLIPTSFCGRCYFGLRRWDMAASRHHRPGRGPTEEGPLSVPVRRRAGDGNEQSGFKSGCEGLPPISKRKLNRDRVCFQDLISVY